MPFFPLELLPQIPPEAETGVPGSGNTKFSKTTKKRLKTKLKNDLSHLISRCFSVNFV